MTRGGRLRIGDVYSARDYVQNLSNSPLATQKKTLAATAQKKRSSKGKGLPLSPRSAPRGRKLGDDRYGEHVVGRDRRRLHSYGP
jgi:hypothetical protein